MAARMFRSCDTAIVLLVVFGMAGAGCGGGSSSARDALDADIAPALASWRAAPDAATGVALPGTAVAVFSPALGGSVTYVVGVTDLASGNPLASNDIFRLASLTKIFTSGITMKLDQEGRLAISDPISKYLPWPNGENITIEMLLSHTSGIPNQLAAAPPGYDPTRDYTPEELLQFFADYGQPDFAPGTRYMYTNTGEIDGFHNYSAYFINAGFGLTVLNNLIPAGTLQSAPGLRELAPVVHASLAGG